MGGPSEDDRGRIGRAVGRFETAWRGGEETILESFLDDVPDDTASPALFEALLAKVEAMDIAPGRKAIAEDEGV